MKMRRRVFAILSVCVVTLVVGGCIGDKAVLGGTGSVALAATVRSVPNALDLPDSVVIDLSMGSSRVRRELPISGDSATGAIDDLAVGQWQIDAAMVDGEGDTVYAGKAKAAVKRATTTPVSITLKAVEGRVRIEASSVGAPNEEMASTADFLVYYSGGSSPYRKYENVGRQGSTFSVEDEGYIPRSYDMRVILKDEDGMAVYESEYVSFGVVPGKTTSVQWAPGMGSLYLDVRVGVVPPAPQAVNVVIDGKDATVTWMSPSEQSVSSYRVYWRYSSQDRYTTSRSQLVDAPADSAFVSLSSSSRGTTVDFVVVAKDGYGQESLRSEEVSVEYP